MNKCDEDIIKTLNILSLLRNEVDFKDKIKKTETYFLKIKKEFLDDANISIHDFIDSLKKLNAEKYLWHISFFDKDVQNELKDFYTKNIKKRIESNKEIFNLIEKINIDELDKFLPKNNKLKENLKKTNFDENEFLKLLWNFQEDLDVNVKSYVFDLPHKNINKLLEKMKEGHTFKELHRTWLLNNKTLEELFYRKLKHSIEKQYTYGDIIKHLLTNNKNEWYFFQDIVFNGKIPTNKQCYDSCMGFNKTLKNKKYFKKNFFEVELNRVRFNPELMSEMI